MQLIEPVILTEIVLFRCERGSQHSNLSGHIMRVVHVDRDQETVSLYYSGDDQPIVLENIPYDHCLRRWEGHK